ncbi:MAG: hypothetical protein LBK58_01540, partial [Prevotellaceae bacterium]|nr:hypothetical protein [Prevotellaceae bacterium]
SVIVRAATEVVLLLESGRNEVCPATNYGRPKTLFLPTEVVLLLKSGRNEVCLYTDYITFMEDNSKF